MNTIPSTFNERQMQCIILGNQKDAKPREIKIPMTVIVLKSGKNHFLDDFFGKLLCYGFEKIIYVDKDNHHSLEGKAIKFPSIEFIIPLERITVGEMINLGIASSNSEKNLVLWDNIKLSATLLKQDFLKRQDILIQVKLFHLILCLKFDLKFLQLNQLQMMMDQ